MPAPRGRRRVAPRPLHAAGAVPRCVWNAVGAHARDAWATVAPRPCLLSAKSRRERATFAPFQDILQRSRVLPVHYSAFYIRSISFLASTPPSAADCVKKQRAFCAFCETFLETRSSPRGRPAERPPARGSAGGRGYFADVAGAALGPVIERASRSAVARTNERSARGGARPTRLCAPASPAGAGTVPPPPSPPRSAARPRRPRRPPGRLKPHRARAGAPRAAVANARRGEQGPARAPLRAGRPARVGGAGRRSARSAGRDGEERDGGGMGGGRPPAPAAGRAPRRL